MDERFGRRDQDDHRRDGQRAERHRAAIDHDCDQHDGRHEERPLRRDLRARQEQIERRRDQSRRSRPFLDREAHREAGDQCEQRAHREEHDARDHRHVIARDREHMAEARDEHRVVDIRRDRIAPAGQQRGRDGALVAIEPGPDARVDRIAQALHGRPIAQAKAALLRRRQRRDPAHYEAGGADALEEHVAREIVAAGPHRRQWGQQPRLELHEAADIGRGALAHGQPDARQRDRVAIALHRGHTQHDAIAALADVTRLDEAGQRHGVKRPRQHRMRHACGLAGRDRIAGRRGRDHHRRRKQRMPPHQHGDDAEQQRGRHACPQRGLMIGGKINRNAGAEGDRHPGQQPASPGLLARPARQMGG